MDVKAVVLARGLATRMRAPTDAALSLSQTRAAAAGLKAMMPVGAEADARARPFLDYVLGSLAEAGYRDVGVVIGPEHGATRERYEREVIPVRLCLAWLIQQEARGTADAVLACERWVGDGPFVVVNGDNLYPVDALRQLREMEGPGLAVFARDELVRHSNIPADRMASFALLELDAEHYLTGIVEKPGAAAMAAAGPRAPLSMNCWRFDRRIFAACRDVPPSIRGEFELSMAVGVAIDRGVRFRAFLAHGELLDLSRRDDVAAVSHRLEGRFPSL